MFEMKGTLCVCVCVWVGGWVHSSELVPLLGTLHLLNSVLYIHVYTKWLQSLYVYIHVCIIQSLYVHVCVGK